MDNDIKRYVGGSGTSQLGLTHTQNPALPKLYALYQNHPNPFNPTTIIKYNTNGSELINIKIYDILGNEVCNLVDGFETAGNKSVQWNATNNQGEPVSAGVYLYKIQAGNFVDTKKMILLK